MKALSRRWHPMWQEVLKWTYPEKDMMFNLKAQIGSRMNKHIYDSSATDALEEFASIMAGLLVNPATPWFIWSTGNNQLDQRPKTSKWLQDVTRIILSKLSDSNFTEAITEQLVDLGSLGTAPMVVSKNADGKLVFETIPVFNVMITPGAKGVIKKYAIKYTYNYNQLVDEYGEDAFPTDFKKDIDEQKLQDKEWEVIHYIEPNDKTAYNQSNKRRKGVKFKFVSYHVLVDKKHILKESGYSSNPMAFPRFFTTSAESFGRSPLTRKLGDVKVLNKMVKADLLGTQIAITPPVQIQDSGMIRPLRLTPLAVNVTRRNAEIKPIFTGTRPDIANDKIVRMQQKLEKAFMLDKLRLVESDRMTAVEVSQRRDEQFRSIGTFLTRFSNEDLRIVIDRVFDLVSDEIPERPKELKDLKNIIPKYTSLVSKAQGAGEGESLLRAIQENGVLIEKDPNILDLIDGDKSLLNSLDRWNVDRNLIRLPEDVKGIREQRAKIQKEAQEAELANSQAQAAKTMGEANAAVG